jgi:hypothetical protein
MAVQEIHRGLGEDLEVISNPMLITRQGGVHTFNCLTLNLVTAEHQRYSVLSSMLKGPMTFAGEQNYSKVQ